MICLINANQKKKKNDLKMEDNSFDVIRPNKIKSYKGEYLNLDTKAQLNS